MNSDDAEKYYYDINNENQNKSQHGATTNFRGINILVDEGDERTYCASNEDEENVFNKSRILYSDVVNKNLDIIRQIINEKEQEKNELYQEESKHVEEEKYNKYDSTRNATNPYTVHREYEPNLVRRLRSTILY